MRKRIARHILLLLLLTSVLPGFSQDIPLIHFTKKDGLPSNMVYQVYRDRTGFLWFATDKGLVRYNGIRFEIFTTANGLTDNDVIDLFEDHYGRIWLNCFKGNLCYYKDGKFYSAANSKFLNLPFNTPNVFATSFEKDSSFTLLFADRQIFVNIKGDTCHAYYLDKLSGKGIGDPPVSIRKRSPATYEVLTNFGTMLIDTNYNVLETRPVSDRVYRYKSRVGQNMSYIVADKTICKDNEPLFSFGKQHGAAYDYVNSVYTSKADTFFGTEKGLIINNRAPILKECRISDVSQDINGNYWISTLNNGLYYANGRLQDVKLYSNCYTGVARFAFTVGETLFFDTNENLFRFDKGRTTSVFDFSEYRASEKELEPGHLLDDKGNYHTLFNRDHFIMQDLLADRPRIKRKQILASPVHNVHRLTVKAIYGTPQYLFFQSNYFIVRLSRSKINTGNTSALEDIFRPSDAQRIYSMAKARDNTIWFSTGNEMYKLVNDTAILQPSFRGVNLSRFYIFGDYMVGWNNSNKLIICNNFSSHMTVDTLPLQDCVWDKAYPLDEQHLLISTNNQYRILRFKPGSGQPAYELSVVEHPFIPVDADYIFSDSHTCYFFKGGNITAAPVSSLLEKAAAPRLFFTGVSTSRKAYVTNAGKVSIPYSESGSIHVSFTALAFGMTDVSYEYMVSGDQEDDWRTIKNEEMNLLPSGPGNYTITIRARSASNVYSQSVPLLLVITPPFWTSWWFILLAALCVACLLWWVIRSIIRNSVKKKEKAHTSEIKFMKLEYKALNALMNPHFIFNSLNNIQGLMNDDNKPVANQYLITFGDLIRQNMHNASKELITLEKEMELINNYLLLEKLRFDDWLQYIIDIDDEVDMGGILIPPLLVQPLVENAIRHGLVPRKSADGLLTIHIHEDEEEVVYIDVKDNGVGLSGSPARSSRYESTGLENIRKRTAQLKLIHNIDVNLHISEITDASGVVQGTFARIIIRTV